MLNRNNRKKWVRLLLVSLDSLHTVKQERAEPLSQEALYPTGPDRPPEAYIPVHVDVKMYPSHLRLLVSTILGLSGNQTNVAIPKGSLRKIIKAALDDMKARRVVRPFKTLKSYSGERG